MDLTGKNVVYIGGFGGIGFETSKELLKRNLANLIVFDIAEKPGALATLQALNPKVKVHFVAFDVTKSVDELAKVFGGVLEKVKNIDLVINGAGILDENRVELTIQTNLIGLINSSIAILRYWDKRRGGSGGVLVNIASVVGLEPYPLLATYSASKYGVTAFTKCLAKVENLTGVSALQICPGLTNTAMLHNLRTFLDLETNFSGLLAKVNVQTAEVCATHIVIAIEKNQNGSFWLIDNGQMELVPQTVAWTAPDVLDM